MWEAWSVPTFTVICNLSLTFRENPSFFNGNVPLQSAMALFTNGNPYRRHLQNDMLIHESSIKCIDFTNNSKSVLALRSNNIKMNSA